MLLPVLERVLDGRDGALVVVPAGVDRESELRALRVGAAIDDDVALVAVTSGTSGTTGAPKGALLSAAALTASASATHERLGGPGSWLLALPPYHIAGVQVLVRSVLAGCTPVELDVSAGFDVTQLPSAVSRLGSGRRYASLVAAQLAKALADPAATAALAGLDAVLIGGATLATGYRNPVDPDPFAEPGWFRTDDLGTVDDAGVLTVLGRADDAISTGGLTVLPQPVEAALCTHPAVGDCAVFGLDDQTLGQRVVAAVVVSDGCEQPTLDALRAHVSRTLDATAAPRELHIVAALPRRGIGKVDRMALVRRFADAGDQ